MLIPEWNQSITGNLQLLSHNLGMHDFEATTLSKVIMAEKPWFFRQIPQATKENINNIE